MLGEVQQEALASNLRPNWVDEGPLCSKEQCPQYDGKRCMAMGFRPDHHCEPAVKLMTEAMISHKPEVASPSTPWVPWTQGAAEELQEEASAWLCWRGVVQRRPYTWLFDENGEGGWFCAAPDGESRMGDGVTHFALIADAPEAPPGAT